VKDSKIATQFKKHKQFQNRSLKLSSLTRAWVARKAARYTSLLLSSVEGATQRAWLEHEQ